MRYLFLLLLLLTSIANAQIPNDGIPDPAGTTTPVNVTYLLTDTVVSEVFEAPDIIDDFGPVGYIAFSPIDRDRLLENIPSFGLAKWHWWLVGTVLQRAQRQYGGCVGEINAYLKLLNVSPLIDEPGHGLYPTVIGVREYFIPFEAVQQPEEEDRHLPPTREIAIEHIIAAIATHNITVYHIGLCNQTAAFLEALVRVRLK